MIKINFSNRWDTVNGSAYVGTVFEGDLKKSPCAVFTDPCSSPDELTVLMNRLNGFWGAVVTDGRTAGWIAADRIRSYPVFYAHRGSDLYISNDAYWVREQCNLTEMDKAAEQEFLMTGYVTGPDTLFLGLKQIQSGECVFFKWSEQQNQWVVTPYRYYRYLHKKPVDHDRDQLLEMLDAAMVNSFRRLIDFAAGRTIVIPLSGGYDSRLVSLMLKRLGYNKLIAYTYGVKNNEESIISKKIAYSLNIPWFFVKYTNNKWYQMYNSEAYRKYEKMAGGLASLPHCQDWIAVKELKDKNIIPRESVFVPGIVANIGAMGKTYSDIYQENSKMDDAIEGILKRHYISSNKMNAKIREKMVYRINNALGNNSIYISPASALESFNYSERQSKYINNFIRGYEFWGYCHYTPYWDKDLLEFWSSVPSIIRQSNDLYKKYILKMSKLFQLFEGKEEVREKEMGKTRKLLGKFYREYITDSFFIKIPFVKKIVINKRISEDSMAWYGCFTNDKIGEFISNGYYNIITMLSFDYIKNIKKDVNNLH